jgi:hypothetical protein
MSYQKALEAAGAEVLDFQEFGSYQGDWWARVRVDGKEGWVKGSYGSCSGCDAFAGEFDSMGHYHGEEYASEYVSDVSDKDFAPETCERCADLGRRLAEFGRGYLADILTQAEAEAEASSNLEWDMDAASMVSYLRDHPVTA